MPYMLSLHKKKKRNSGPASLLVRSRANRRVEAEVVGQPGGFIK